MTTLDTLADKADKARAAYEKAQAQQAEALAAEQARIDAARADHDRTTLTEYDDTELVAAVTDAENRLRDAVLADPIWQAVIDVHAARITRYYRHSEAQQAASRLDATIEGSAIVPTPTAPTFDTLLAIASDAASRIAHEQQDTRDAAREAAGQ